MPGRSNRSNRLGPFVAGMKSEWNVRLNNRTSMYDLCYTKMKVIEANIPTRALAMEKLNKRINA